MTASVSMSIAGAIKGISVSVTALSSEDRMEVSILDNLMNRTSRTRIRDPTTWTFHSRGNISCNTAILWWCLGASCSCVVLRHCWLALMLWPQPSFGNGHRCVECWRLNILEWVSGRLVQKFTDQLPQPYLSPWPLLICLMTLEMKGAVSSDCEGQCSGPF